jgi:hypothetical protein
LELNIARDRACQARDVQRLADGQRHVDTPGSRDTANFAVTERTLLNNAGSTRSAVFRCLIGA